MNFLPKITKFETGAIRSFFELESWFLDWRDEKEKFYQVLQSVLWLEALENAVFWGGLFWNFA